MLAEQGLYNFVEGAINLPDNGQVGLPKVATPVVSVDTMSKSANWNSYVDANAIGFLVYINEELVATLGATVKTYNYGALTGKLQVVAKANNLFHANSELSLEVSI
ncbi:MAG: hypothetical protein ACRC42_03105 [Mycoplasma sp.]